MDVDNVRGWTGPLQHLHPALDSVYWAPHKLTAGASLPKSHPVLRTEGEDVLPFAKRELTAGAARLMSGRKHRPLRTGTSPAAEPGAWLTGQKGAGLGKSALGVLQRGCSKQRSRPPFPIAEPFLNTPDAVQCPGPVPSLSFPLVNASIPC